MQLSDCRRCSLRQQERVVLPSGKTPAPLMVIGHKPSRQDSVNGQAFTDRAGTNLKILLKGAGIHEAYYTLLVKCPGVPKKIHVQTCKWWLWKEIQQVQPKIILTLGHQPSSLLLKTKQTIEELAGEVFGVDWFDGKLACYWSHQTVFSGGKDMQDATLNFFKSLKELM